MADIDRFAGGMTYEVLASEDLLTIVPAIRDVVRSIDGKVPILNVKTQTDQIDEAMSDERVFAKFTSALGLLVLILAGIGLYGRDVIQRDEKNQGNRNQDGAGRRCQTSFGAGNA